MKIKIVRTTFLIPRRAHAQVLLPRTIYVRRNIPLTMTLLAHELRHVAQLERMGLLRYWFTYLVDLIKGGYKNHPMEQEAILAEASTVHRDAAKVIINTIGTDGEGTVVVPPY